MDKIYSAVAVMNEIVFDRDGGGYTVTAPDLDGVVTWGKNLAHAKKMAKEAIELCVECCVEQGVQKGFSRGQLGVVRV